LAIGHRQLHISRQSQVAPAAHTGGASSERLGLCP
jgi:hypothetical protein